MSPHLSAEQIARYRRRELSPPELLAAADHLAACAACQREVADEAGSWAGAAALAEGLRAEASEHVSYEQLEAFVDGALDEVDREIVSSHLELCAPCEAEAADLGAFKASLAEPAAAPAPAAPARRSRGLRDRLAGLLSTRWVLVPIGAAAAAALTLWALTPPLRPAEEPKPKIAGDPVTPPAPVPAPPGDGPTAPEEPTIALVDGGGRVTLDRQGNLTAPSPLSASEERAVKAALSRGRVDAPREVAALGGRAGTLMGAPGEGGSFAVLRPAGTAVESARPVFRWRPLAGATSYTVTVYGPNFEPAATSGPVTGTRWTPPHPLARGRVYSWQVTAAKDGREVVAPAAPAAEAKFLVVDGAAAAEIARARRAHAGSHLLLGTLYARAGLLEEAEREFRALVAANPDSPVARGLLASVRGQRR